jgi:hypothetical protein
MNRLQKVLACLGFLVAFCSYCQDAPLTTDTIIQMKKAGLPDDVIISKIKADGNRPKLSANDLIQLKSAGVSDGVIRELVGSAANSDLPAASGITSAPVHSAATYLSGLRRFRSRSGDIVFRKTKLADAKGRNADADLIFRGDARLMVLRVADRSIAEVPYGSIDKLSYDYSKHHRIKQGAVVMFASLGAGGVVMLTKSKDHWFTIDYHDGDVPKSVVLKLDKKEYKEVLRTAEDQTGKEIEFLKDAKL